MDNPRIVVYRKRMKWAVASFDVDEGGELEWDDGTNEYKQNNGIGIWTKWTLASFYVWV